MQVGGERERREQLIAFGTGNQIIVPDHGEVALSSLDTEFIAESARRVAIDFPAPRNAANRFPSPFRTSSRNRFKSYVSPCPRSGRPRGCTAQLTSPRSTRFNTVRRGSSQ